MSYTSTTLFAVSASIVTVQREIEELRQKKQTKDVVKRLEIKLRALALLQEEATYIGDGDDEGTAEPEQ